jgi:AraC-like DNA-binding protein
MSTPSHPRATRVSTDDISVVNASSHPSWRDQTYLLRPGPIRFTAFRLALDEDLRICRWSYTGAARTFAHLADGSLYVAFPKGEAMRVEGLPIEGDVVTLSLGAADYSGSTLRDVACEELLVTGRALEALLGGDDALREALTARCGGRMSIMRAGPSALTLRESLRHALEAGAEGLAQTGLAQTGLAQTGLAQTGLEEAADLPIGAGFDALAWREALAAGLRAMLPEALATEDLLADRAGSRRHALARDAERLIWRRVASGDGGLSLDELCAELGTTRRTLQLAFQDHFDTPVGIVTRSARLQRVRTELGSGAAPAVSEAAMRCGFEHLGRFARYYRDFFGESPSATLRDRRRRDRAA